MKKILVFILVIVYCAGCKKDNPLQPFLNKTPKTFFWILPDSTIREGQSKQHLRWWGEDPDGIIKGYLFVSDTLPVTGASAWRWTTATDTFIAFPLLKKRDTFRVAVRAVDNTFWQRPPDTSHALIRLSPMIYWDKNENGIFDSIDVLLPSLAGAIDPKGATQPIPLLNTPPTIQYASNPNDPAGAQMQQPETTFTAVTFSWVGSDSDGVETIKRYEFALNDTTNSSSIFVVPSQYKLISLVVPRTRSDTAGGIVDADVYGGTFLTTRKFLGTIHGMKLDSLNKFFVRAKDIAGDSSRFAVMPDSGYRWFVKRPRGKLLIITDYLENDKDAALNFYKTTFPSLQGGKFAEFSVLNIGAGKKADSFIGNLVPPFIDPAFSFTLHLFDVVFWYTDRNPSLNVAQYSLFQYTREPSHTGKVIFSTMFESTSDPRGALRDFAPIDSISSADLVSKPSGKPILPRLGDSQIPGGYSVYPDSSDVSDVYPELKFNISPKFHFIYMRPIYKRSDARYIYRIQDYAPTVTEPTVSYSYLLTLNEFSSTTSINNQTWVCGQNSLIYSTTDNGQSWVNQQNNAGHKLQSIFFIDQNHGWCVGDSGAILQTSDAGNVWNNNSQRTFRNLNSVHFVNTTTGLTVGTQGIILRSTDGGVNWSDVGRDTSGARITLQVLRSVHFADQFHGIAVGDSGTIIKTTNGGISWKKLNGPLSTSLNSVRMLDTLTIWIVDSITSSPQNNTNIIKSTDGGTTWTKWPRIGNSELRSVYFYDNTTGFVSGVSGTIYNTTDGGTTWSLLDSRVTQNLNSVFFASPSTGWAVGGSLITTTGNAVVPGGGVILRTSDGGATWQLVPRGDINVGVIDGDKRFVFLGLPLHRLNSDGTNVKDFLEHVLFNEFGF